MPVLDTYTFTRVCNHTVTQNKALYLHRHAFPAPVHLEQRQANECQHICSCRKIKATHVLPHSKQQQDAHADGHRE